MSKGVVKEAGRCWQLVSSRKRMFLSHFLKALPVSFFILKYSLSLLLLPFKNTSEVPVLKCANSTIYLIYGILLLLSIHKHEPLLAELMNDASVGLLFLLTRKKTSKKRLLRFFLFSFFFTTTEFSSTFSQL